MYFEDVVGHGSGFANCSLGWGVVSSVPVEGGW